MDPLLRDDPLPESPEIWADDLSADSPPRDEKREQVFRVVEYSHYPRTTPGQRRRVGFTRNESFSGLCLVTDQSETPGSCLRVGLQGVDGSLSRDALVRVVWHELRPDGRHWLGLSLIAQLPSPQMAAVRSHVHCDSTLRTDSWPAGPVPGRLLRMVG
ncbi:MAG: hypothetical protein VCC04_10625 [Myxococcota bacterium]